MRLSARPTSYDQNTKAKAIRLVREHRGDYPAEYAAITAVAGRLGMTPETLRKWLRQAEVDEGTAAGTSTAESAQVRELKRRRPPESIYGTLKMREYLQRQGIP